MADAAVQAAHEEHRRWDTGRREHGSVVARTGWELDDGEAARLELGAQSGERLRPPPPRAQPGERGVPLRLGADGGGPGPGRGPGGAPDAGAGGDDPWRGRGGAEAP